jgi:hypothetical protein
VFDSSTKITTRAHIISPTVRHVWGMRTRGWGGRQVHPGPAALAANRQVQCSRGGWQEVDLT